MLSAINGIVGAGAPNLGAVVFVVGVYGLFAGVRHFVSMGG
jgi:hypothetical protein